MAVKKLMIRPGINKQFTPTLNIGGYADSNLIRFRDGLPQGLGGWTKYNNQLFEGVCRGLHGWVELTGLLDIGVGTHKRLYLLQGGIYYDITPLRRSVTLGSNPIATTSGAALVTMTDTGHGAAAGDLVIIGSATAVGGLTLAGEYSITSVTDSDNYVITASGNASATATGGGGSVTAKYLLPFGYADANYAYGYGIGPYGEGAYGVAQATSNVLNEPRTWSLDNWGEQMIASPSNGAIYAWVPPSTPLTRAAIITNAPIYNAAVIVGMPQQQIIAFGAEVLGTQDPLLVRWSDSGDFTVWLASQTNLAGSYRIPRGSRIVAGLAGPQQILIWTNEGLWLMQFIGLPFVYSFTQVGFGTPLMAPKAATIGAGTAYWMGADNFYHYDGSVKVLPCTVWDSVFGNLNALQKNKIFTGLNSLFNEIFWFYPSANSTEVDSYVKYNWVDQVWDAGLLTRTAWEDKVQSDYPLAVTSDGVMYAHEATATADGGLVASSILTGYIDLADGEERIFIDRIIPDFAIFSGQLRADVYLTDYPSDDPTILGPYAITPTTPYITLRGRGRQIALKLTSVLPGTTWRMGAIRVNAQQDGRR